MTFWYLFGIFVTRNILVPVKPSVHVSYSETPLAPGLRSRELPSAGHPVDRVLAQTQVRGYFGQSHEVIHVGYPAWRVEESEICPELPIGAVLSRGCTRPR